MRDSLTLGRIAGISFGVNWSWVIVLALIVGTLATGIFPTQNPDHEQSTYIAMAIVAALLFFTSLLMHEFGHALEAKHEGVEIEGITLWLFGGVAKFRGMFPSAGAEFRIAIAGPLVSLGLGAIFVSSRGWRACRRWQTASPRGSATSTSPCWSSTCCPRCRSTGAECSD